MEGCSKYCSFCVVPYTRGEEVSRPLRRRADRGGRAHRPGREGDHAARPERERLPRPDERRRDAPISPCCSSTWRRCPGSSASATPPRIPKEFTPAPDRRLRTRAAAGEPRASAGAVRLRPRAGGDEARLHRARVQVDRAPAARRAAARSRISSDFIVGFPGETEADFEATLRLVDEVGFDASFSFVYSRAPRHARGQPAGRHAARGQARAAAALAGPAQRAGAGHQPRHGRHAASACWWKAPRRRIPASCPGAPRTTAW